MTTSERVAVVGTGPATRTTSPPLGGNVSRAMEYTLSWPFVPPAGSTSTIGSS